MGDLCSFRIYLLNFKLFSCLQEMEKSRIENGYSNNKINIFNQYFPLN
jgi:hypothetical protein